MADLSQRAAEKLQEAPTADGRLGQLESRVAELEAQNRLLEKQRAEPKKALAEEKRGKEHATFYADSFVFPLIEARAGGLYQGQCRAVGGPMSRRGARMSHRGQTLA